MMAGNPNWWSISDMHPQNSHSHNQMISSSSHDLSTASNSQYLYGSSSLSSSDNHHLNQDFPIRSWSQLLLGGYGGDEDRFGNSVLEAKKLENWEEEQVLNSSNSSFRVPGDVKQEIISNFYRQAVDNNDQFQACKSSNWLPVSSPNSCVTSLSNSILNFSTAKGTTRKNQNPDQFNSSECNSSSSGGVSKKPRVQHSSTQPALKVRKEKLGDRITTLHQLVSPFGKTDTASVLSESIGYIRFLQAQIEALCSPYMRNNTSGHQQSGNDLRSKGLCLVPLSFTQHVGHDINGASDCWTPSLGGGF